MKIIHSIAAGGQTWAHRMRMLKQVFAYLLFYFHFFGGVLVTSLKIAKEEPKENLPSRLGIWQKLLS